VGNNLQSIDYAYNIRGWMTDINKDQMSVPNLDGKLFSYKIKYTQKDGISNPDTTQFPGKNVMAKYNGNIAEVDWRSVENIGNNPSMTPKRYGYAYDGLNRLTAGYYQNPQNANSKENTEFIDYDLNGNITNLYRTSVVESGNTATVIDRLQYTYESANNSNTLTNIIDLQNNPSGYEGGGGIIHHDPNGNMDRMDDKNIENINYNFLNLPNKIKYSGGIITIDHLYNAGGIKLQKKVPRTECGIINCNSFTDITDYLDGFQYLSSVGSGNGGGGGGSEMRTFSAAAGRAMEIQAFSEDTVLKGPAGIKTPDLQFFPTAEGFYDYKKDQYIYQYKDHLGNTRVSFARNIQTQALEIVDKNDYYPFGMNHFGTGTAMFGAGSYKNYKYNGKELQESGMYDYGARMYMSDIGRWGVIDPLAEKMTRHSPYNYAFNNPISFIDPDGREGMGWGLKDGKWNFVEGMKAGDSSYQQGGYTEFKEDNSVISDARIGKGESGYVKLGEGGNASYSDFNGYVDSVMNQIQSYAAGNYVRAIPSSNSPEVAMGNPSGQLAVAGLYGLQGGTSALATEYVAAKTGLTFLSMFGKNAGFSWSSLNAMESSSTSIFATSELIPTHAITKSKTQMQTLLNDVAANGVTQPVKYVEFNGQNYIVDGHHRLFSAQRAGISYIPVEQVQLPYGAYKTSQHLMMEGSNPGYWKFMKVK
jgi:RHS repeat-associated protein